MKNRPSSLRALKSRRGIIVEDRNLNLGGKYFYIACQNGLRENIVTNMLHRPKN